MVRRGPVPAWRRDHVTGPGAADGLGLDPGQPGGTGQVTGLAGAEDAGIGIVILIGDQGYGCEDRGLGESVRTRLPR
jgi:hypothetical protein